MAIVPGTSANDFIHRLGDFNTPVVGTKPETLIVQKPVVGTKKTEVTTPTVKVTKP